MNSPAPAGGQQRVSPWWRHDANLTTELRFTKLRTLLKADPYGLICRVFDLAASIQQDGDLSKIDDAVLAQRVEFTGKGSRLRRMLIQAGYLDGQSVIIEWRESLFRFFTANREQNRQRGLKSAAVRSQRTTQPNQTGEERTATVTRPVERPVDEPSLPLSLSSDVSDRIASKCHCTSEGVLEAYELFRGNKLRFADTVTDLESELAAFLRTSKEGKFISQAHAARTQKASNGGAVESEPAGWREWVNENRPDACYAKGGADEGKPWSDLDQTVRSYIRTSMKGSR